MVTGGIIGAGSGGKGMAEQLVKLMGPRVEEDSAASVGASAGVDGAAGDGVLAAMGSDPLLWAGLGLASAAELVGAVMTPVNHC